MSHFFQPGDTGAAVDIRCDGNNGCDGNCNALNDEGAGDRCCCICRKPAGELLQGGDDSSRLVSLVHDPAHYARAWQAFLARSDADEVREKWIRSEFSRQVVDKLEALFQGSDGDQELRILGVGSGSGGLELLMTLAIRSRMKVRIRQTVVEPAADLLEEYRRRVKGRPELDDIEFDFRLQTIEEYRADDENRDAKFHFISAVEVLCHVKCYEEVIGYLYDSLVDGGILHISLDSDDSSWAPIFEAFPQISDDEVNLDISSRHVRECFERRSVPYESSRMEIRVDFSSVCVPADIDRDVLTTREESSLLVDIASMSVNFARSASPKFYRELMTLLRSEKCTERGVNGKILFKDTQECVIVQKNNKLLM